MDGGLEQGERGSISPLLLLRVGLYDRSVHRRPVLTLFHSVFYAKTIHSFRSTVSYGLRRLSTRRGLGQRHSPGLGYRRLRLRRLRHYQKLGLFLLRLRPWQFPIQWLLSWWVLWGFLQLSFSSIVSPLVRSDGCVHHSRLTREKWW